MARSIDHLVLAVPDLAAAMAFYGRLGFTVGARNRHPWGTENAVIQLDGAFLELIALGPDVAPPAADADAAPFAGPVAAAVARGGGLCLLVLGSDDADADAAAFRTAGLGQGRRLDFGRTAVAPDGARRDVSFSLAFADTGLPEAGLFTCRHHRPENFWNPAAQRHDNGAERLDVVVLAAAEPARAGRRLARLVGLADDGLPQRPRLATPTGRIDVMTPAEAQVRLGAGVVADRFAGFGVVVPDLDMQRRRLVAAGVPHGALGGALVVPPEAAFGAALAFAPAACHSLA